MSLTVHRLNLRMSLAYLIENDRGVFLVDAGLRGEEGRILSYLKQINRTDLKLIFITHAHLDHYGSAAALRRLTGAPIAIHGADAQAMEEGQTILGSANGFGRLMSSCLPLVHPILKPEPAQADLLIEHGNDFERFGLNAEVLHTPGHTIGSSCLMVNERFAFVGDLVTNSGKPRLQRYFAQDWALLPDSFNLLFRKQPDLTYTGHGDEPIAYDQLLELKNQSDIEL